MPGYFVCQEHVQEKLACVCGDYVVTAEPPARVFENGRYGPGFIAHIVVAKCLDALPIHRMELQFERLGIPMSRSTMTDLFHRAAEELMPVAKLLLAEISKRPVVLADETSFKIQDRVKRGFFWTFIADELIAYRFSVDRSGDTPNEVLGGTRGVLLVDGYTGYNQVTQVEGRVRAGCLAHARRKIFEALEQAPEAKRGLEIILDIYEIEHDAKAKEIIGTAEHLALRHERARPAMARLQTWLTEQRALHPPKSKMGVAIAYTLRAWPHLEVFLDDARVPVDNNKSERSLRIAALGRKNFLFVGHEEAGKNLAGLYSLVATCRSLKINPETYLADVLMRVQTHPVSDLAALLPQNWSRRE